MKVSVTVLEGEFGIQNVCLSVPCIVSTAGVEKNIESALPGHELAAFCASTAILEWVISQLGEVV